MQNPIHRLLILFIIFSHGVNGQNIDNVTSLREIGSDKGIRFYYDNDFFITHKVLTSNFSHPD